MSAETEILVIRSRLKKWTRNALIVSVLAHIAFGIIAGFWVAFRSYNKTAAEIRSEPPPRPALDPRKLEMKVKMQDLQKRSARPKLQPRMVALSPSDLALPEIKQTPKEVKRKVQNTFTTVGVSGFGQGIGGGYGTGLGGGGGAGTGVPKFLSGRCSPMERQIRLRQNGGDLKCEEAVMKALRWLKTNQNEDGSWGDTELGAMTGLALLAFLGHCETHLSPEFGVTVQKAIDFLLAAGNSNNSWLDAGSRGHGKAYAHGIATYALAEAYSITRLERLPPVVEKAAKIIIDGQGPDGGWVYGYAKNVPSDTSVCGWQIQALKAVHVAGLKVEGLEACLDKSMANILRVQCADGTFGYRTPGSSHPGLVGVGAVCLQMWKNKSKAAVTKASDFMANKVEVNYAAGNANLYAWYYNTLACFMKGGSTWEKWNKKFQKEIVGAQNADGSWPATGSSKGGRGISYQGTGDSPSAVVYRTALCTLMLEVYYRYLPTTS